MVLMLMVAALTFMVMVLMIVVAALTLMVMVLMLLHKLGKLRRQSGLSLHGVDQLLTGELIPRRDNQGGGVILLPQQFHSGIQLLLRNGLRSGKDNSRSRLHLVIVELAKVLGIHFNLAGIHNRNGITQGHIIAGDLLHSCNNIGQLANTGRLNKNAVGMVFFNDLFQRLAKVAHQRAANAAGVHLRNVDTGILQETAINTDLAKLVLNEDQLLALVAFLDHFLDQCGFTSAQKARINIDFSHSTHLLILSFLHYTTTQNFFKDKMLLDFF